MRAIAIVALALLLFAQMAYSTGEPCTAPGQQSTCPSAPNPPYSGAFCKNFARYDSTGTQVQQVACNCMTNWLNGVQTVCNQRSDCCIGYGCDVNHECTSIKHAGDVCNTDTQNCDSNLYCKQGTQTGVGTCTMKGGTGAGCSANYMCLQVCRENGCGAPTQANQHCRMPQGDNDDPCVAGDYCAVVSPGPGATPDQICQPKKSLGELCSAGRECGSGMCWDAPGSFLTRVCVDPKTVASPDIVPCYSNADCYAAAGCNQFGACALFQPFATGSACKADRECQSEKCLGGLCANRTEGEICGIDMQCDSLLQCLADPDTGKKTCRQPAEGSDPVIDSVMFNSMVSNIGPSYDTVVTNNGRDAMNVSVIVETALIDNNGNTIGGNAMQPTPLLEPGQTTIITRSFTCPANGYYTYQVKLLGVSRPVLNLSLSHTHERETAIAPVMCGGCEQNHDWLPAALAALIAGAGIAAAMHFLSHMFSSQGIKAHAEEEVGALLVTIILLAVVVGGAAPIDKALYNVACPALGGSQCGGGTADVRTLAMSISQRNIALASKVLDQSSFLNTYVSEQASKSAFCSMLGVGVSVAGCSSYGVARGPVVQMLTAAGFAMADQYSKLAILQIACGAALPLFLPLGILLRAFKFSRGAGNFIIALALAAYAIFPLAIIFADSMVNNFFLSPVAQNDPKFKPILANVNAGNVETMPDPFLLVPPSTLYSKLACDPVKPDEGKMLTALITVNSPELSDTAILLLMLRGPFETLVAVAIAFAGARGLAAALGTEIEIYHIARLS